ncbi:MAG: hypothetical protein J1G05_04845 [Clostridiales bacterium]|nr:hypothetical protein [Clostridiales bacterium]
MGGYSKSIAVIRGLKEGFSADGGQLTGVVKIESYGRAIRVEVTKINFAPLSEGKYVTGITDGKNTVVFEGDTYESDDEIDTGSGFAALICFVNGQVSPIASAVSGNYRGEAIDIKNYIEQLERVGSSSQVEQAEQKYEDEAIAEDNYYEYAQTDESGNAVRTHTQKEEGARTAVSNEETAGVVQKKSSLNKKETLSRGGSFYDKMKGEIEGLLSAYPEESALCALIEESKWVKINYGDDKYYVFGVIYSGGNPQYLCYGVPTNGQKNPPESMEGLASFVPANVDGSGGGYWVMYQDAYTGASIKVDVG